MNASSQGSAVPASQAARPNRIWMAVILAALSAFGPFSIDMYLPALPAISRQMQSSASVVQLTLTACLMGLALGQLVVGPVSDTLGRRRPLLAGIALYFLASAACALSPTAWVLALLRFIQGLAGSAGIVISRAVVRDLYEGKELTRFFSLLMVISGAAPIIAPLTGGQVLRWTSWRGVFVVLTVLAFLLLVAVWLSLPETLPAGRRQEGGLSNTLLTFAGLLKDRLFMGYALSQGLVFAAMFAYISGSPFVLQTIFGVSPQVFSFLFALNALGIIGATQLTGMLSAHMRERTLNTSGLMVTLVGSVGLLAVILTGTGLVGLVPALFVTVASVGIVRTTSFSLAMEEQAKHAGSASALLGVLGLFLGSLTAPLVGIAGEHTALPMGVVIASSAVLASLVYFLLTRRRDEGLQGN